MRNRLNFSGRRPSQNAMEIAGFVALLKERKVRRYGEIGAREGNTFHYVMCELGKGATGVALDLPGALWGNGATRGGLERATADLVGRGIKASCMFGDSTTRATVQQFANRGPYDAILIDGDHTLAGVTADWTNYGSMAPIVAFHDIVGTGQSEKVFDQPVEVPILWESIKRRGFTTVEFVAPDSRMGIGVVLWNR